MKKRTIRLIFLALFISSCTTKTEVDLIVHNAVIYTVDENFSIHEAMAINDGIIVETGPEHQVMNKYTAPEIIDAAQQFIYPGFIDGHCHFMGYARYLSQLDLNNTSSPEEMFASVDTFSKNLKGDWLLARGWDQNNWDHKIFPDKTWLDQNLGHLYVVLKRVDGHAALVNQKVLDLAGINENSEISGGKIEVVNGKCTGLLIDNAVDLVTSIIPDPSEEELKDLVLKAQDNCFAKGITTVSDAGLDLKDVNNIQKWMNDESLKMKFYIMLNPSRENFNHFLKNGPVKTEKLTINSFKFYADGALGSRGAALLQPYEDDGDNRGLILTDTDSLKKWSEILFKSGFQMNTHAIGDSANRLMLDIYSAVLKGSNDRRWRLEHAQVVNKNDLIKFGKYNIIPSVQPTHATSDMDWAEKRLGGERIQNAYSYQSLKNENGLIALGTDFPVEQIDPLLTMIAAVSRTDLQGKPEDGNRMEEGLSFEDCLRGMTIWAAIANFQETDRGSLEAGKKADFIIINRDLKFLNAAKYPHYRVLSTYVNGKMVYQNQGR